MTSITTSPYEQNTRCMNTFNIQSAIDVRNINNHDADYSYSRCRYRTANTKDILKVFINNGEEDYIIDFYLQDPDNPYLFHFIDRNTFDLVKKQLQNQTGIEIKYGNFVKTAICEYLHSIDCGR